MGGVILVISGPSGAGKSTIIERASGSIGEYYFSISTTTRPPREGEQHGVDYYFVSMEEFEEDIKRGNFLEYAIVHGNYYGTSLQPVKQALSEGKLVIFDIDVQGHRLIRAKIGDLVTSVFITPPTLQELERRLYTRSSENLEVIQRRIENAKGEIKAIGEFDFVIINDILDRASQQFAIIANASRLKLSKQELEKLVLQWENSPS